MESWKLRQMRCSMNTVLQLGLAWYPDSEDGVETDRFVHAIINCNLPDI